MLLLIGMLGVCVSGVCMKGGNFAATPNILMGSIYCS